MVTSENKSVYLNVNDANVDSLISVHFMLYAKSSESPPDVPNIPCSQSNSYLSQHNFRPEILWIKSLSWKLDKAKSFLVENGRLTIY